MVMRLEEVNNPRVELALDSIGRQFGEQDRICQTVSKARDLSRETALISRLTLGASIIVGKVEAACPK